MLIASGYLGLAPGCFYSIRRKRKSLHRGVTNSSRFRNQCIDAAAQVGMSRGGSPHDNDIKSNGWGLIRLVSASTMLLSVLLGICVLSAIVILSHSLRVRTKRLPLPPGPKGWPFIGNLLQIPRDNVWKFYGTETLQKYGALELVF